MYVFVAELLFVKHAFTSCAVMCCTIRTRKAAYYFTFLVWRWAHSTRSTSTAVYRCADALHEWEVWGCHQVLQFLLHYFASPGPIQMATVHFATAQLVALYINLPVVMLIVGCTSKDGRPAKSARRSDREDEDMTHAYL
jgi:hypothetical protein